MSAFGPVTVVNAARRVGWHVSYRNPITRRTDATGVITGVNRGMVLVRYDGGPPELTHCANLTYLKGETE